jgi:uncharacterized protein YbjT (DUF2867 family)
VWHAQGEAAIRASGVPFTFVQPSGFMENCLWWASSIKSEGVVRSSAVDGKSPVIHSDDIAAVATKALTTQAYIGESLRVTGPELLSYPEMVAKIGARIGKPLRFEALSDEEERRQLLREEPAAPMVEALISFFGRCAKGALRRLPTPSSASSGESRSLSTGGWKQHAAAFR